MRIVFIGTGEIGVPTLQALLKSEYEIVAVVTQPDKPVGRAQLVEPSAIKKALTGSAAGGRPLHYPSYNRRESKSTKQSKRFVLLHRM